MDRRRRIHLGGGLAGSGLGIAAATRLSARKAVLGRIFASLVFSVAVYVILKNLPASISPG